MGSKTKKTRHGGRFGALHGIRVRKKYNIIEDMQRKRQKSPFYEKAKAKRISAGIWKCMKTGKVFAGPAYALEQK